MSITNLPEPPSRQSPSDFDTRGDSFMAALPAFVAEANALAAEMEAAATNVASAAAAAAVASVMSSVVLTSGSQAIDGVKTFSSLPVLPGNATAPLQAVPKQQLDAAVAGIVNSAPAALDALNELAAALGNDPNFATTVATALGLKAPLLSPALSGSPTAPTPSLFSSTTAIANAEFVQRALGNNSSVRSFTTSGPVTNSDAGKILLCTSATSNLSLNFDDCIQFPLGAAVEVINRSYYSITLNAAAGDSFWISASVYPSSIILAPGESISLGLASGDNWVVKSGSVITAPVSVATAFVTPLPSPGTVVSMAHGLTAMPAEAKLEITCLVAEGGYAVGDVLQSPHMGNGAGSGWPLSVWKNASHIGFTIVTGYAIGALRKDTGQAFIPTYANWSYRFVIRAT